MRIASFQGQHRFLSNFWPVQIPVGMFTFESVEHAYQAAKHPNAEYLFIGITPGAAKRLSRQLLPRRDWGEIKLDVMEGLLRQKFGHTHLRELLTATWGYELIEGNAWGDTFWDVCNGVGENHLGRLLMKIREEQR